MVNDALLPSSSGSAVGEARHTAAPCGINSGISMLTWQVHGGAMVIDAVPPSASGSPVGEARPTAVWH